MAAQAEDSDSPRDEYGTEFSLARHGKVSYLEIPALDGRKSAAFYAAVFGWNIRGEPDAPSFDDVGGGLIGRWILDRKASGEPGMLPYIYVTSVDKALAQIPIEGGEVLGGPSPEGDLWTGLFRDPAGNVLGIWQSGPR